MRLINMELEVIKDPGYNKVYALKIKETYIDQFGKDFIQVKPFIQSFESELDQKKESVLSWIKRQKTLLKLE